MSGKAILVGLFILQLKRCIVPSRPKEVITTDEIYQIILLAHGRLLGLLLTLVCCLESCLYELPSQFCQV